MYSKSSTITPSIFAVFKVCFLYCPVRESFIMSGKLSSRNTHCCIMMADRVKISLQALTQQEKCHFHEISIVQCSHMYTSICGDRQSQKNVLIVQVQLCPYYASIIHYTQLSLLRLQLCQHYVHRLRRCSFNITRENTNLAHRACQLSNIGSLHITF